MSLGLPILVLMKDIMQNYGMFVKKSGYDLSVIHDNAVISRV